MKQQMRSYAYLEKWWITGKFKIDQEAAFKRIEQYREQKLKDLAAQKRVQKWALKIETIHNTVEDLKQLVCAINEGSWYYGFSGRRNRFYNPIPF